MDTFDIDYKSAEDLCGRLQAQVGDARAGQGGASAKYLMKTNYNKVKDAMSNFDKLLYNYKNNPSTFFSGLFFVSFCLSSLEERKLSLGLSIYHVIYGIWGIRGSSRYI